MSYDQNIADRLWAGALKQMETGQYPQAIYSAYARWERLRPNNVGFLRWMATNVYKHTKEPKIQERYMEKYHACLFQSPKQNQHELPIAMIKWMMFKIEHSLNESIQTYERSKCLLFGAVEDWLETLNLTERKDMQSIQAPLPIFHAMMILRPSLLDRYLTTVYRCMKLPSPRFANGHLFRKTSSVRSIGFVWLSLNSDPSYKCLKAFVQKLSRLEKVTIYLNDATVSEEVRHCLSPASIKCVGDRTNEEVAEIIYNDEITIMINNFWDRTRGFQLFALRPAPVCINFMGVPGRYLNTELFQYSVSDVYMHEEFTRLNLEHAEKSIILPQYYQIASALSDFTIRKRVALKRIGILARPLKITSREMFVCREILRRCKDLTVVLICSETDLPRVTESAIDNGLLPEYFDRVKTAFQTRSEKYTQVLNSLDLCIDTYSHFGALSTGIEALSIGCPLLSCSGSTLFSCHSQSLLKSIGVDDSLLCEHEQDMIDRIERFVASPQTFSSLCDRVSEGFTKSRINDLDYRTEQFAKMLERVENDYRQGKYEDIVIE